MQMVCLLLTECTAPARTMGDGLAQDCEIRRGRLQVNSSENSVLGGIFWWLRVDLNHRPQHYECRALTN